MRVKPYEFFEHTADIGLRARGKDLSGLFIHAAEGMFAIIAERRPASRRPGPHKKLFSLSLAARDREELLVSWLSELLSLSDIHNVIFSDYIIREITDKKIKAQSCGEMFTPETFIGKTAVKAVTYHGLKIETAKPGSLIAEIIFDT